MSPSHQQHGHSDTIDNLNALAQHWPDFAIIHLRLGDIVPADVRVLEGDPLQVDQP